MALLQKLFLLMVLCFDIEYVYCSNTPTFNPLNIPVFNRSDLNVFPNVEGSTLSAATLSKVYLVNWAIIRGVTSTRGPPGAASASYQRPCRFHVFI